MFSELEHILRTHGDHEVLSDQASLRDMVTEMRRLADELGLNFRLALSGVAIGTDACLPLAAFDPCI